MPRNEIGREYRTLTSDFIFNVEHQGRVRNGSLRMSMDDMGAVMEAELDANDDGHRALYNDIRTGRLDRMSFSFTIAPDGVEFDEETKIFRVKKIERLYDVSAVAFPAYDGTSISARCADLLGEYRRRQTGENSEQRARKKAIALSYTF